MTILNGSAGDDVLDGASGNDTLYGLEGNDILNGNFGADAMYGGMGDDLYYVDDAGDTVFENEGEGYDTVRASVSFSLAGQAIENLTLIGGGNISATGNVLDNILTGNWGNNRLDGGAGADAMAGGEGDDTYFVDNAGDTVAEMAGGGYDTVRTWLSYTAGAWIEAVQLLGAGNISAAGNGLDNSLTGNTGNNILSGGAGADLMRGGAGNDIYFVDNVFDVVGENADEGIDTVYASVDYALNSLAGGTANTTNVERLVLQGSGDWSATGNGLDNLLVGNAGHNGLDGGDGKDRLFGYGGQDRLDGGHGADAMYGGAGDDTYWVDDAGDRVSEQTVVGHDDGGVDTVIASVNFQLPTFVDNLTLAGAALKGAGNAGNNVISGNDANNVLYGLGGNDVLDGAAGVDIMDGGAGDDTYYVDNYLDRVIERASGADSGGNDTVLVKFSDAQVLSFEYAMPANVENGIFQSLQRGTIYGNNLANTLTLGDGGGWAEGMDGNDIIGGGGADDHIEGGAGNDALYGNDGDDTLYGNTGTDFLSGGKGNDTLYGGNGGGQLYGGQGNDTLISDGGTALYGEDGNDRLYATFGTATLYGGSGTDYFYLELAPGTATVTIADFSQSGNEYIQVSASYRGIGHTMEQHGNDVVISFSNGDTITVLNATFDSNFLNHVRF